MVEFIYMPELYVAYKPAWPEPSKRICNCDWISSGNWSYSPSCVLALQEICSWNRVENPLKIFDGWSSYVCWVLSLLLNVRHVDLPSLIQLILIADFAPKWFQFKYLVLQWCTEQFCRCGITDIYAMFDSMPSDESFVQLNKRHAYWWRRLNFGRTKT